MKQDTKWRLRDTEGKEYIIIDSEKVDMQEELNKMITKQMKEIERLHSIIKEVREKLNTRLAFTSSYQLNYQSAMSIIEESKNILQGVDKN